MDKVLYVAMSGAKQTMLAQQANNHNMANVNTTGFLADLNDFRSMQAFGDGHPTRVYAMTERPGTDFSAGNINHTGRDMDVAVQQDGWIAVMAKDGTEAYTRAGDLRIESGGQLITGTGLPVMGNGGPIAIPPASKIDIGLDGTISVLPLGQQANELAVVDRVKLVNPPLEQMHKGLDGLMRFDGGEAQADANQQLVSGAMETSNVNVVSEMVDMIELSKRFEMQVKMMKTTEENATAATSLLRPV